MMIVIILTQTMERSSSLCSSSLEVSRDDVIIVMIVIILTQTMERSSSLCSSSLEVSRDDVIIIRARARKVVYL